MSDGIIYKTKNNMLHHAASLACEHGILNERAYRDAMIKEHFQQLRSEGKTVEECELILSEKWSSKTNKLTPESIHYIIYRT